MLKTTSILLGLLVLILPLCALADSSTTWSLGAGGTYQWTGNNAPLTGSGIDVGSVSGGPGDTTLSITSGILDFTSGAYAGSGWNWDGGGTFTIDGCIAGVTTSNDCSNNVLLSSGDFDSVSIVPVVSLGQYSFDVEFSTLTGTLNSSVAAAFGVPEGFAAESFNLILAVGQYGGPFKGTNLGGEIVTTPAISAADDASLFGGFALYAITAGMIGLAWRFRKSWVH